MCVARRPQITLRTRRPPLLALALALLIGGGLAPSGARAGGTIWRSNLYRTAGYLTQDPYFSACTAASTMMMLNFVALAGSGGNGFVWRASTVKNRIGDARDMTSIFAFARAHDTLSAAGSGSDPHGWRNALNYYGWGSDALTPDERVYDDRAYIGFDAAVKDAVLAIARHHMPVGMLAWAGGHAQVITGYLATGENPEISTNFTVNAVYLSDPLAADGVVNKLLYVNTLRLGPLVYRFRRYSQVDSPYDDPYTPGWILSSVRYRRSEWFARYVLIVPIRNGLPGPG
jgi:hypothetical protein